MKNNNPNVYNIYKEMFNKIVDNNIDELNSYHNFIKSNLEFLFLNANVFENVENIDVASLQEYILLSKNSKYCQNIDYSNNFLSEYYSYCDSLAEGAINSYNIATSQTVKEIDFEKLKDAFANKYFSTSLENFEKFYNKYVNCFDILSKNPDLSEKVELFKTINNIFNTNDFESLVQLYNSFSYNFTVEEIEYIDDLFRKEMGSQFADVLDQTKNSINSSEFSYISVEGKQVKVVEVSDNFSFLVHSSDTGFTEEKVLKNNSFYETFSNPTNFKTHGLSTSYISDINIGCAPVGNNGVLYAFNTMSDYDFRGMGNRDINSNIVDFGFTSCGSQMFESPDELSMDSLRLYNEILIDRETSTPDYVILMSDASEQVRQNSYKAAAELDIPVVVIDINQLADNQNMKIDNLLSNFSTTNDVSYLQESIRLFEANVSGYNLNVTDNNEGKFCNIHDSVQGKFDSTRIEESVMDYVNNSSDVTSLQQLKDTITSVNDIYSSVNEGTDTVAQTTNTIDLNTLLEAIDNKLLTLGN